MVFSKKNEQEKLNPENLAATALQNIMAYDFDVATSNDPMKNNAHADRFVWLVNMAESVLIGSKIIVRQQQVVEFDNLKPAEEKVLEAARELFASRYGNNSASAMNVENRARALLVEAVEGVYDSKLRKKEGELKIFLDKGNITKKQKNLELARYKYQLMIEAAESKKIFRKEMNF